MTKFTIFLWLFVLPFGVLAQVKISGQITDSQNKPLELLEVQLQNNQALITHSDLTDSKGNFSLTTPKGTYTLLIKHLGKVLKEQTINASQDVNLGIIILNDTPQQLQEVVVNSKKKLIERKVDRLVFNVENSISASGGDAIDALKITPGIRVQNDAISMIGKSGMAVMVNDRIIQLRGEDVVNYLKTLSSDDIKKIEVITTPPAKYDAEGNSGLINIVLKQGVLNSWSNSIRSAYIQTTYPSVSMGNTLNYSKNKFNIRATVDGKVGNELGIDIIDIQYADQKWETTNNRKISQNFYSSDIFIEYISKKSKIGFNYILNNSIPNINDNYIAKINSLSGVSSILSNGNVNQNNINHSFNVHLYQTLDTIGKKVGVELDYVNYKSSRDRNFLTRNFDINQIQTNLYSGLNNGSQKIDIYSARVDVEHPNKYFNLSYGAKISTTKTNNDVSFFETTSGMPIIDLTQTDNFLYTENTQALYINGNKNISEKWSIQLGLRYEFTQTLGESITLAQNNKLKYNQFFPTFYLQHTANENNIFNINYSKRIKRPTFSELNPFRWYINEYSYAEGNPFLQPSFADNFEFTHIYKSKLISTMFFQYNTNGFGQVPVNKDLELAILRKNFYNYYTIGISETYIFNKFSWWQSQNTLYTFYTDSKIISEGIQLKPLNGFTYNISTNNSFILNKNKTLTAEVSFNYQGPMSILIADQDSNYSLDFGVRYFMLDKNLQISFNVYDFFKQVFLIQELYQIIHYIPLTNLAIIDILSFLLFINSVIKKLILKKRILI